MSSLSYQLKIFWRQLFNVKGIATFFYFLIEKKLSFHNKFVEFAFETAKTSALVFSELGKTPKTNIVVFGSNSLVFQVCSKTIYLVMFL